MSKIVKEKLVSDNGEVTLDIKYNHNWQEYIVRWNEKGVGFDEEKAYHTDDRDDAIGTMKLSMRQYNEANPVSEDKKTNEDLKDFWNWLVEKHTDCTDNNTEKAEWKAAMVAIDKLSNRYDDYVLGKVRTVERPELKRVEWKHSQNIEYLKDIQAEISKLKCGGFKLIDADVGFFSNVLTFQK